MSHGSHTVLPPESAARASGGIGRRAGLRILWRDPWGFESPLAQLLVNNIFILIWYSLAGFVTYRVSCSKSCSNHPIGNILAMTKGSMLVNAAKLQHASIPIIL